MNQILGDQSENAEVTLLPDNGVDLHSYQPTADDIVTIAACDMFIYVGGHSDEWVDEVLAQAKNEDMVIIDLFDVLGGAVKEEEIVDGMEHEHEDEDHEHDEEDHEHVHEDEDHEHDEEDHEHVHEDDEHVWLSLKNAKIVCNGYTYCQPINAKVEA